MRQADACDHERTLKATQLTPAACPDCGVLFITAEYLAALDERNAAILAEIAARDASARERRAAHAPAFGSASATTPRKRGRA